MSIINRITAMFAKPPMQGLTPDPRYREIAVDYVAQWISRLPDPDAMLKKTGRNRAYLKQLLYDAEVAQCVETRYAALLNRPWRLENNRTRVTQWLDSEIRPHAQSIARAVINAILFGFVVCEILYAQRDDGRIGIASIIEKPMEWFVPQRDGSIRFYPNDGSGGPDGINVTERYPEKFLLIRSAPSFENPYGTALLSPLLYPVLWKSQGWNAYLSYLETVADPIVVAKTSNYEQFVEAMLAQGVRRVIAWQQSSIGADESINTINTQASGDEFKQLDEMIARQIQKVILGQTLTSDVGGIGSYAAANIHNIVRQDKARADVVLFGGVVNSLIHSVCRINSITTAIPVFVGNDDVQLEVERAKRDAELAKAGIVRFTLNYLTDRYDFTDEDIILPDQSDQSPTQSVMAAFAGAASTQTQQQIDGIADSLLSELDAPISIDDLRAAIFSASDMEDLYKRLAMLLDKQDPRFKSVLEKSLFAARVLGFIAAEQGRS